MKKLFTIDDIVVALIAALGYSYGETIEKLTGWPTITCLLVSFALGLVLQGIISRIAFSETIQSKKRSRVTTYIVCFLVFAIAQAVSVWFAGVSVFDYVFQRVEYVIILPVLGFVMNLLIRKLRIRWIRKEYGDWSEGFVFDDRLTEIEKDILSTII